MLEAGEARTVTGRQTYDAQLDDVWDACTNPERIPRCGFCRSPATCATAAARSSEGWRAAAVAAGADARAAQVAAARTTTACTGADAETSAGAPTVIDAGWPRPPGGGTSSTGRPALRSTPSALLPSTAAAIRERPRVPGDDDRRAWSPAARMIAPGTLRAARG